MSAATIASGLKARLATISGLQTFAYVPDNLVVPAAIVGLPTVEDASAGLGFTLYTLQVHVLVGQAVDSVARDNLNVYMDPFSVRAAIEGDTTLGGAAKLTRLARTSPATVDVGGITYLAAVYDFQIWA